MEDKIKKQIGLPNHFKIYGLLLVIAAFPLSLLLSIDLKKEVIVVICQDIVIIGLMFIIMSRDKILDERMILIRFKVAALAFFFGVGMVIVQEPINYIFELVSGEPSEIIFRSGKSLVLLMLVEYVVFYELAKRDMLFKGKEN